MDPSLLMATIIFVAFFLAYSLELISGKVRASKRPLRDALFCLAAMLTQPFFSGIVVAFAGAAVMGWLFPAHRGDFAELPFWPSFLVIFFLNEFSHYWAHRAAHEWRWLWKLHRTHHSGMDMNASLIFRYNIFWPLIVPQTWLGTAFLYLGQGEAFLLAAACTYLVNVLTHISFRWDLYLLARVPFLERFWPLIENTITLPDTHQAHHAYGREAHPNGNYAVTLFFFDRWFGTAKIPRARQQRFGLPISPRLHWAEELFWPLVRKPLKPK